MKCKLEQSVFDLLQTEPFFAHFLLQCKLVKEFKDPRGNAAVGFVNGVPTIMLDMDYYNKVDQKEVTDTLKHEVLHLVLNHLLITKNEKLDPMVSNIAHDCVINQHLSNLPASCVSLDVVRKLAKDQNLEPFQTSEYYYKALMKQYNQQSFPMPGGGDVHLGYFGDEISPEMAQAIVKDMADKAVKAAAGNVPKSIMEEIGKLGEAKLPWKTLLKNSILSQVSKKTQATRKRINRRFALPVPGKKKKREMTLGVCVDESGSVGQEEFEAFMNEIGQIAKQVTKTYLIHADCAVSAVEDLSKTKFKPTRRSSGGTLYQPAIDKATELGCNMIVYFGDFDTADKPKDPKVPFIWVGVGNQPAPASFGKVIRL